jgi:cytidine deaminase
MREAHRGCQYSEHAEMNAMSKLPTRNSSKKIASIDFFVARISNQDNLRSSRPCSKCLKHMYNLKYRGYRVRHIYYIDVHNNITKSHFNTLFNSNDQHVTRRFR